MKSSAWRDGQIVLGARPGDLQPSSAADGFPFAEWVAKPLGSHIVLTGDAVNQHVRVVVPPKLPYESVPRCISARSTSAL